MKIMVVYDSMGGNTEKMAEAIAEGASSAGAEVEVKKIGEAFPISILEKADGVAFGSPCIYASVTEAMRGFLNNLEGLAKADKINVKGKTAMVFGSYGWDGAWVMEEYLKDKVGDIGFDVSPDVCVEVDTNIKYHADQYLGKCKDFAKNLVESLKK
jgi:flavorubredoxin